MKNQNGFVSGILIIIVLILLIGIVFLFLSFMGIINFSDELNGLDEFGQMAKDNYDNIVEKVIVKKKNEDGDYSFPIGTSDRIVPGSENDRDIEVSGDRADRFYYSQLTSEGKLIYDSVIDNLDEMKVGNYVIDYGKKFNDLLNSPNGDKLLNDYFQAALNAVLLDNPQVFYLDITKIYLSTKSTSYPITGTVHEVSLGPAKGGFYLADGFSPEGVRVAEEDIRDAVKEAKKGMKGGFEGKIKTVHDYLVDNLEYDSQLSGDNIYNIYGALINQRTVCEGYAKAFKLIMDELGIPCVVICGYAQNSNGDIENHAWNYVENNGKWYAVDVTWDDPILIGKGTLSEESKYKYFLKGSNSLFVDHEEDGEIVKGANFEYPVLNEEDY